LILVQEQAFLLFYAQNQGKEDDTNVNIIGGIVRLGVTWFNNPSTRRIISAMTNTQLLASLKDTA
jgi:hypothetical protein